MKKGFILTAVALLASAAVAQTEPSPNAAEEALRGAAEQIMNGVRMMILAIPQYEAPVQLENGDILIRRKQPASNDTVPDNNAPSDL
ncbi:MAG: hypothetical protein ABL951_13175 [Alphaproteobacteria bacterium]